MQWMRPPLGFSAPRWHRVCLDAAALLEVHGDELVELGWSAIDTFGLHAEAPGVAVDCYGLAIVMDGGAVAELRAKEAVIVRSGGAMLRFTRGRGRRAVPAWNVVGSAQFPFAQS